MTDDPLEYLRPASLGPDNLARALAAAGSLRRKPPAAVRRVFLDTFDWRLFRQGIALEAREEEEGTRLVWRTLRGAVLRHSAAATPRFARDLPEGPLRADLEAVVEMRALLPVLCVRTRSEALELLDAGGKVVCRVYVEEHRTGAPEQTPTRSLPPRVRVEPVRGYDKVLVAVREALRGEPSLEAVDADVLEASLAELGVVPSDHSTKVRVDLDPQLPAFEATRLVLRRLLETLEDNEAGTRTDVDSEFLHDFRVAVRRTRSALGQLKAALPAEVLERFRPAFAWLGAVTTPTRDLDVHLLDFPRYRQALPPDLRGDLEPLRAFLEARQRREHEALARTLVSRRYRTLVRQWRAFLKAPATPSPKAPAGSRPVRQVADERIRKMLRRALKEGRGLGDRSPPEEFHELRKTCKKLRYLVEFFQSLYPAAEIRLLVDALKELQDNLGEFQDLHVQAEALRAWAREMEAEGSARAETQLAMGMLVEKLLTRQGEVRREFAEAFRAFDDPVNRERFERLFRPAPPEEANAP
jgi:CHAD domain-containing protein